MCVAMGIVSSDSVSNSVEVPVDNSERSSSTLVAQVIKRAETTNQ